MSEAASTRQSALALSDFPGQIETVLCFGLFDAFSNKMQFSLPCILLILPFHLIKMYSGAFCFDLKQIQFLIFKGTAYHFFLTSQRMITPHCCDYGSGPNHVCECTMSLQSQILSSLAILT